MIGWQKIWLPILFFLLGITLRNIENSQAAPSQFDENTVLCNHDFDFANTVHRD
jgi:hypothetical protein